MLSMNISVLEPGEGRSVWVVGDRYTIKASGEDTDGAFALIEAVVPPQGGPPPHRHHREDEAFYVLEGEFEFHSDGRRILAPAGAWAILPRGSLHYFRNVGPSPARMLTLIVPAGFEKFLLEVGREASSFSPEAGAMRPGDIEKILAAAPRYAIDFVLSESSSA